MKPLFAKGVDAESVLAQPADAGDRELAVAGADSLFAAGQPLFCSQADGAGAEYLGLIEAVGSDSLTTAFALATAKASGARVWTPLRWLPWPVGRSAPLRRVFDSGVEVQRSAGGVLYHTRLRDPFVEEAWVFERIPRAAFEAWRQWFLESLAEGFASFTVVDEERHISLARIADARIEESEAPAGVARVELRLAVASG